MVREIAHKKTLFSISSRAIPLIIDSIKLLKTEEVVDLKLISYLIILSFEAANN